MRNTYTPVLLDVPHVTVDLPRIELLRQVAPLKHQSTPVDKLEPREVISVLYAFQHSLLITPVAKFFHHLFVWLRTALIIICPNPSVTFSYGFEIIVLPFHTLFSLALRGVKRLL